MAIPPPFNLNKWLAENRGTLKPPVGNRNLYKDAGDYIVMVVAGPNARKDYHYNETEELFYQLEGNIEVHIQEEGQKKTMKLGPGDMYLHPAKIPHSPVRHEGSIGLVIERKRDDMNVDDGLLWFCDNCNHKLYEAYFTLHDIEKDFLGHFEHFYGSEELRTCDNCGTVMPTDERFIKQKMIIVAKIIVALVALLHLYFLWLEMFVWTTKGPKVFRNFPKELFGPTKQMAANQGLYNGFLAAGLIWSLLIHDATWSIYVALFFLGCVTVAGIYGAISVSKKIFYIQGMPALLGILAFLF